MSHAISGACAKAGNFFNVSKILVVGAGPLPEPEQRMPNASVLRTWQFARSLQAAGYGADLIVLPAEGTAAGPASSGPSLITNRRLGALQCTSVNTIQFHRALGAIQEFHDRKRYDGVVAVGLTASVLTSRIASSLPMWFDLGDGPGMAEAQARGRLFESDDHLRTAWARHRSALRRGDRFSTAASRHSWTLIGELASLGRLNRHTDGHSFVSTIFHSVPEWLATSPPPSLERRSGRFRGSLFPAGAFAVLWTGTFHSWTDLRTLASGLSLAMEQEPQIHFVCAGGALPGIDEVTYPEFAAQLDRAGFGDRCHLLDWTTSEELLDLLAECDLGILVDEPGYATVLGSHARLLSWMASGLSVLTTTGSELADTLAEQKLVYPVRMGKVQELADLLVRAARHPIERGEMLPRAQRFALEHFSAESTTRALVRWAGAPSLAADNAEKLHREPGPRVLTQTALNPLEMEAIHTERNVAEELARTKQELEKLNALPVVRAWRRFFK